MSSFYVPRVAPCVRDCVPGSYCRLNVANFFNVCSRMAGSELRHEVSKGITTCRPLFAFLSC